VTERGKGREREKEMARKRERGRAMNAGLVSAAIMETDRATCDGGGCYARPRSGKCAGRAFPDRDDDTGA